MMVIHRLLSVVFIVVFLAGCDNANDKANAMFVEASSAATAAVAEPDTIKRIELLTVAKNRADAIIAQYASTKVAVQIAGNNKIGPYTKAEIEFTLADLKAKPEVCLADITKACFLDVILNAFRAIEKLPQGREVEPAVMNTASAGWLWLRQYDPRFSSVFANSPTDHDGFAASAGREYVPQFIRTIADHQGGKAAAEVAQSLASIPALKGAMAEQPVRLINEMAASIAVDSYPATRTMLTIFAPSLSPPDMHSLGDAFCGYNQFKLERPYARVRADCTAAEISTFTTSFVSIAPEEWARLYEAAPSHELKLKVAKVAADSPNVPAVRLQWVEKAGLTNDAAALGSIYDEAVRSGDRAGSACLDRFSALISGASAGVRLPSGSAAVGF